MNYKQGVGLSLGIVLAGAVCFPIFTSQANKNRTESLIIEYRLEDQKRLANLRGQSVALEKTIDDFAMDYVFPSGAPFEEDKPYWEDKVSLLEEISQKADELGTSIESDPLYQLEKEADNEARRLAKWYFLGGIVSLYSMIIGGAATINNTIGSIAEKRKKKKESEQQLI